MPRGKDAKHPPVRGTVTYKYICPLKLPIAPPLRNTNLWAHMPFVLPGMFSFSPDSFPWLTPSNPSEFSKDITHFRKDSLTTPLIPDPPTPVWIGCHACVLHSIPCWKLSTAPSFTSKSLAGTCHIVGTQYTDAE